MSYCPACHCKKCWLTRVERMAERAEKRHRDRIAGLHVSIDRLYGNRLQGASLVRAAVPMIQQQIDEMMAEARP